MERLLAADKPEAAGRHRTIALIAAALTAYERAGRPARRGGVARRARGDAERLAAGAAAGLEEPMKFEAQVGRGDGPGRGRGRGGPLHA